MSDPTTDFPPREERNGDDETVEPSPRAFASATGTIFQTVGALFLLGSCCFWSFSGTVVPRTADHIQRWTQFLSAKHAPLAALGVGMLTTFVGGIALVAMGVGLTGERRHSGTVATIVALVMTLIYGALSGVLLLAVGSVAASIVAAVFAFVCGVLFLLAAQSASVLRRFPPPPDQGKATAAFLDEERRKRAERLQKYDP